MRSPEGMPQQPKNILENFSDEQLVKVSQYLHGGMEKSLTMPTLEEAWEKMSPEQRGGMTLDEMRQVRRELVKEMNKDTESLLIDQVNMADDLLRKEVERRYGAQADAALQEAGLSRSAEAQLQFIKEGKQMETWDLIDLGSRVGDALWRMPVGEKNLGMTTEAARAAYVYGSGSERLLGERGINGREGIQKERTRIINEIFETGDASKYSASFLKRLNKGLKETLEAVQNEAESIQDMSPEIKQRQLDRLPGTVKTITEELEKRGEKQE